MAASAAGVLAGVMSCADTPPTVHKTVVDVGEVWIENSRPQIQAPATAAVGSAFAVDVTTIGDGCYAAESTDVVQSADGGELTPYDRHIVPLEPHSACPAIALLLAHSGEFQFASPGAKLITIHGAGADYPVTVTVQ